MKTSNRILVTGSSGVLGKAILAELSRQGYDEVLAPSSSELDLRDASAVRKYLEEYEPYAIFHLASLVFGLAGNMARQLESINTNTQINVGLLGSLAGSTVKKVFFAGTVASYPFPYKSTPLIEADFFDGLPHYGEFGYAFAKRHAYGYLEILRKEVGIDYVYGIFTNIYGPHDRFNVVSGHVVPSLISKLYSAIRDGTEFEVWGNGTAERDFIYADDAARASIFCMLNASGLINISSGKATTIREVSEHLVKIAGHNQPIKWQTDKPIGIPRRVVDNKLLMSKGFTLKTDIFDGLEATYRWYKENHEKAR